MYGLRKSIYAYVQNRLSDEEEALSEEEEIRRMKHELEHLEGCFLTMTTTATTIQAS
jgi:hypothetical protein